jgi:hypothetical protein
MISAANSASGIELPDMPHSLTTPNPSSEVATLPGEEVHDDCGGVHASRWRVALCQKMFTITDAKTASAKGTKCFALQKHCRDHLKAKISIR